MYAIQWQLLNYASIAVKLESTTNYVLPGRQLKTTGIRRGPLYKLHPNSYTVHVTMLMTKIKYM